jgi:aminocarboxymuconate-semialdehyde decarboxylase
MVVADVHMHLVPPRLVERARRGICGSDVSPDGELVLDGAAVSVGALYEIGQFVASLDERGIDIGCVSIPPPLYRQRLAPDIAKDWAREVNDALEELATTNHARIRALAHLPIEHPQLAAEELGARAGSGWAGYAIASHAPGMALSDPGLRPVWEALDAEEAFVFIHPADPEDERLGQWYLSNLLGNPYETALAAAQLLFGGVLSTYPSIRFCLAHAGGVTAAVSGRWQRGFESKRPGVPMRAPPAELLRRLYVDCVALNGRYLEFVATVFGGDHIVLGSDWPFPMGSYSPAAAASCGRASAEALRLDADLEGSRAGSRRGKVG